MKLLVAELRATDRDVALYPPTLYTACHRLDSHQIRGEGTEKALHNKSQCIAPLQLPFEGAMQRVSGFEWQMSVSASSIDKLREGARLERN